MERDGFKLLSDQIGNALNVAEEQLRAFIRTPLNMRYVAQTAAIPALNKFSKNPNTKMEKMEWKAAILDFSRPAQNISGFFASNSRALLDHAETLKFSMEKGNISISLGILRSLLERVSIAWTIARKLSPLTDAVNLPRKEAMDALLEHNTAVMKALYGTTRDWHKILQANISKGSPEEDKYEKKEGHGDLSARGILNYVQDLDRRVSGLLRAYHILCDFAHPNVGDFFSSTINFSWREDGLGLRIYTREIAEAAGKDESSGKDGLNPDIKRVLEKIAEPCCGAIAKIPEILEGARKAKLASEQITKTWMRLAVKDLKPVFERDELCPCLFGARLYQCCGKLS